MKVNTRIKKAGTVSTYTLEQIEELDRCMYGYTDPTTGKHTIGSVYFAKHYARIQHATRGDIPFEMYKYQEDMMEMFQNNNKSICLSARQTGKEQPHSSKIATPYGWINMGEISIGDNVLTPDGQVVPVIDKFPQGVKDVYKVSFDDGSTADCGLDHLWTFYLRGVKYTAPLSSIIQHIDQYSSHNDGNDYSIYIPLVQSLNFAERMLPVPPYELGKALSDTDLTPPENTTIPPRYLIGSQDQRTQLMKGILDHGLCTNMDGYTRYVTPSDRMSVDVQQLVWSLGGKCSKSKVGDEYLIDIVLPHSFGQFYPIDTLYRRVINIELVRQEECSCILIDHPDHLYVTDNFTVTHNSVTSGVFLLWFAMFNPNSTVLIASNKNDNAMEMIKRIQYTYECLPMWMKPGVVDGGWNKHEIGFDNDSRILSQATSANTGRGLAVTLLFCLGGDTKVTVRNKHSGEILDITLTELYQKLLNCDGETITITVTDEV